MTMYKLGTQLILSDLWAAAAAHKLGFEVGSLNHKLLDFEPEERWVEAFETYADTGPGGTEYDIEKWRIIVTESGPNAAGRFLPQVGDLIEFCEKTLKVLPAEERALFVHNQIELGDAVDFVDRIIERNNTPFPQFSEVIEL